MQEHLHINKYLFIINNHHLKAYSHLPIIIIISLSYNTNTAEAQEECWYPPQDTNCKLVGINNRNDPNNIKFFFDCGDLQVPPGTCNEPGDEIPPLYSVFISNGSGLLILDHCEDEGGNVVDCPLKKGQYQIVKLPCGQKPTPTPTATVAPTLTATLAPTPTKKPQPGPGAASVPMCGGLFMIVIVGTGFFVKKTLKKFGK